MKAVRLVAVLPLGRLKKPVEVVVDKHETEDLDEITSTTTLRVLNGEHRRNLVTRGTDLIELLGQRFQIGDAIFEYDRPRPPCTYIQGLTGQPGLTRSLGHRGGICVRVVKAGRIRLQDPIVILNGK